MNLAPPHSAPESLLSELELHARAQGWEGDGRPDVHMSLITVHSSAFILISDILYTPSDDSTV